MLAGWSSPFQIRVIGKLHYFLMFVNKTVIKLFKFQEDLTAGQPHKRTTLQKDNLAGKITSGDDLSGRQHHQFCIKLGQANGPSLFFT